MVMKFDDWFREQMQDEEFRREYEALEFEEGLARKVTEAREAKGLTREQLAGMVGVQKDIIEDFENVNTEASLNLLYKLTSVLGLRIELQPA